MTGTADAGRPKYPYFEEETSVYVVNARMGPDVDPRLREVMGVLDKHPDEGFGWRRPERSVFKERTKRAGIGHLQAVLT